MPDGWNTVFGIERFKVAEGLLRPPRRLHHHLLPFQPCTLRPQTPHSPPSPTVRSVACDVDTRPHLLNNVILTGAGSLIEKLRRALAQ